MRFLNMKIDNLTADEALKEIEHLIKTKKGGYVVTPNINASILIEEDKLVRKCFEDASLVLLDSQPLFCLSKILKHPFKEKLSGTDLFPILCQMASEKKYKIFLLGGKEENNILARQNIQKKYPKLNIVDNYSPRLGFEQSSDEIKKIIKKVRNSRCDILIVCLGTPKQEIFMHDYIQEMPGTVAFGFGCVIDIASGKMKRAPKWMRKCCLEWLYRLCKEPRRLFKRVFIAFTKFPKILWKYRKMTDINEDSN